MSGRVGLRGPVVLVDHAAGYFPALHGCIEPQDDLRVVAGPLPLLAGLVRAVAVVVAGLSSGHGTARVGARGPYGANPPPGIAVRSWRPPWNRHDLHAIAGRDFAAGAGELGVTAADEEANQQVSPIGSRRALTGCCAGSATRQLR